MEALPEYGVWLEDCKFAIVCWYRHPLQDLGKMTASSASELRKKFFDTMDSKKALSCMEVSKAQYSQIKDTDHGGMSPYWESTPHAGGKPP